jgi:hypothetical protein
MFSNYLDFDVEGEIPSGLYKKKFQFVCPARDYHNLVFSKKQSRIFRGLLPNMVLTGAAIC